MKKRILALIAISVSIGFLFTQAIPSQPTVTGAPPYDLGTGNVPDNADFSWLADWKRPEGPTKVALQVGHWKNDEVPDELHRLRGNTGAIGGGKIEWEVNYEIAMLTKEMLEKKGIVVEILPATVPPQYWADVFVAIHADGHTDLAKSGFKAAAPRRDATGKAEKLVEYIRSTYYAATQLDWHEETITRNMTGYYAFSWRRYEHAVHPMTVSAILETGFLTTAYDRTIIVDQPELSAEGLSNGIIEFLHTENLL